jgi:hypothetical protein
MEHSLHPDEFIRFAQTVEQTTDGGGAPIWRCAARLRDGTYLPCVALSHRRKTVDTMLAGLKETLAWEAAHPPKPGHVAGPTSSRDIIHAAVSMFSRVGAEDIAALEPSRYALPAARLREITSETRMGWTQFIGVMKDGVQLSFGTHWEDAFFDLPDGYTGEDVVRIIPHGSTGGPVYRDRPYFTCLVDGLLLG